VSSDVAEMRLSCLALIFPLLRWDNNLLFWLTKSKLLIIKMLGSLSVLDATLNTKDYVLKNVRLHDVFEVFQLFLCKDVAQVRIFDLCVACLNVLLSMSLIIDGAYISAGPVINKRGVVAKFSAFAFVSSSTFPCSCKCARLSLEALGINGHGPHDDDYDDDGMEAVEDLVPHESRVIEHEEVRDYGNEPEEEVAVLNLHVLMQLII